MILSWVVKSLFFMGWLGPLLEKFEDLCISGYGCSYF